MPLRTELRQAFAFTLMPARLAPRLYSQEVRDRAGMKVQPLAAVTLLAVGPAALTGGKGLSLWVGQTHAEQAQGLHLPRRVALRRGALAAPRNGIYNKRLAAQQLREHFFRKGRHSMQPEPWILAQRP